MSQSRKTKTEFVPIYHEKDWRNCSAELEYLGHRLDAVREIIDMNLAQGAEDDEWCIRHWRQVESILLRKWKHTLRLKETGLRQVGVVREGPEVKYDWWEPHDGISGHFMPILGIFDGWFNHRNLDASWAKAQEEKLQKARKGLA